MTPLTTRVRAQRVKALNASRAEPPFMIQVFINDAAAAAFTDLRNSRTRRKLNSPDVFLSQKDRPALVQFLRRHPGEHANTHFNTHTCTHARARYLTHTPVLSPARAPSAAPGLSRLLYTRACTRAHAHICRLLFSSCHSLTSDR